MVLHFPPALAGEPVISNLVRRHDVDVNILRASIEPNQEGLLVLEFQGAAAACEEGVAYLRDLGIKAEPLSEDVVRNDKRCLHCGACTSVCATWALSIDRMTMEVGFDSGRCTACKLCVAACPTRAMEVRF